MAIYTPRDSVLAAQATKWRNTAGTLYVRVIVGTVQSAKLIITLRNVISLFYCDGIHRIIDCRW